MNLFKNINHKKSQGISRIGQSGKKEEKDKKRALTGRVELNELHVLVREPSSGDHCTAITSACVSTSTREVGSACGGSCVSTMGHRGPRSR